MKTNQSRRDFLKKSSTFCVACGALAGCPGLRAMGNFLDDEIPDPKKLEYCGYSCPPDCPMYKATIDNDPVAKKAAFNEWQLNERYGIEFEEEKVFCYGCKPEEKPLGITASHCPVRTCVVEKGMDCCIECDELAACEKGIWTKFPEFHKSVIQMQVKYRQ